MPGHIGALQEASEVGTILNACFIDGETKVQGGKVIFSVLHNFQVLKLGLNNISHI